MTEKATLVRVFTLDKNHQATLTFNEVFNGHQLVERDIYDAFIDAFGHDSTAISQTGYLGNQLEWFYSDTTIYYHDIFITPLYDVVVDRSDLEIFQLKVRDIFNESWRNDPEMELNFVGILRISAYLNSEQEKPKFIAKIKLAELFSGQEIEDIKDYIATCPSVASVDHTFYLGKDEKPNEFHVKIYFYEGTEEDTIPTVIKRDVVGFINNDLQDKHNQEELSGTVE